MLAGLLLSCQRKEDRGIERVAILPFENLSSDATLDWVGPALAGMLVEQASASLHVFAYRTEDFRDARLSGAVRVVQGYYSRLPGRLNIRAVIEDLRSRRNVESIGDFVPAGNLNAAADRIARAIDPRTRPFGTQNGAAIRAWGESLAAPDAAAKVAPLRRAIAADPNFGRAYLDLAGLFAAAGDRVQAQALLKQADERMSQFTDLERARLEFLESGVRQDERQRRDALMALSRLVTTDVTTVRTLAQAELNARRFDSAADLYKSAAAIDPDNPALLNELGYAESYRGNLAGARAALERYRGVQPRQANPLDSLGDVHFSAGRFEEAEKFFLEAHRMEPGFLGGIELEKAALARYLRHDRNGADELYAQFDRLRRELRDAAVDVRKAEWLSVTGRTPEAVAAAGVAARNANTEIAAYALCHLSLWTLDAGDNARAADLASQAAQQARNPSIQAIAALCRFAADPSRRTDPSVPPLARAYASLFAKDAANAMALLKPMYDKSLPANDGDIRTLYAWALSQAGRPGEAGELLKRYFIPIGTGDDSILTTQAFPHFVALRSAIVGSK